MILQLLFLAFSLVLSLLFFVYGFNHYYLQNAANRYRSTPFPKYPLALPAVSIQLPVYNEKNVIRRLVTACAVMVEVYGKEKASIFILDDSDDDTVLEVDRIVQELKTKQFHIETLRRNNRNGFKAGALQAALNRTEEEFIAIFDADFVPPPDFLQRALPYFDHNQYLGIVQGRWTYLNKNFSLLTQAISHAIDVHFLIEQPGRFAAGIFQNFNGSGGVLRKKAVIEAGGWQADTLAEDLDLSYRLQMLGYRILYLKDLVCPCEIPPTVPSFKLQQGRWACGSFQTALKILPQLVQNAKIGFKQRLQAFIHLTGYLIQPLMVISFVLACLAALMGVNSSHGPNLFIARSTPGVFFTTRVASLIFLQNLFWAFLIPFIVLCTIAPWISLVLTLKGQNLSLVRNLASLLLLLLLCFGISLSTMRGVLRALFTSQSREWIRTPKYADSQDRKDWQKDNSQLPYDSLWLWELVFVIMGLWAIVDTFLQRNLSGLFVLIPFTISYAYIFIFSFPRSRKSKA